MKLACNNVYDDISFKFQPSAHAMEVVPSARNVSASNNSLSRASKT